jgi:hypothetical protein
MCRAVIVTGETQDVDFGLVRNLSERIRQAFGLRVRIEPPMEVDHSFEFCRFIGLVFGDGDHLLLQGFKSVRLSYPGNDADFSAVA